MNETWGVVEGRTDPYQAKEAGILGHAEAREHAILGRVTAAPSHCEAVGFNVEAELLA